MLNLLGLAYARLLLSGDKQKNGWAKTSRALGMKMERESSFYHFFPGLCLHQDRLAQVTLEYMYVLTRIWYLRHRSSYFNYRSLVKYYQEKIFLQVLYFFIAWSFSSNCLQGQNITLICYVADSNFFNSYNACSNIFFLVIWLSF